MANPQDQTSLQKEVGNLLTLSSIRSGISSCLSWLGYITTGAMAVSGAGAVGAYQAGEIKTSAACGGVAVLSGLASYFCLTKARSKSNEAIEAKAQVFSAVMYEYAKVCVDDQSRAAFVNKMKDYSMQKLTNPVAKAAVDSYLQKRNKFSTAEPQ